MGYNAQKYNFNSKYLFEYLLSTHPELELYFIINDDNEYDSLKERFGNHIINTKTADNLKLIFSAYTWISSGSMPARIPFANRDRIVVNLGHGMPLKGLGLMNQENSWIQNQLIKLIYSKYDIISSTSVVFQNILMRSYASSKKQVRILGQCWDDEVLSIKDPTQILYSLYDKSRIPTFNKTILYAPTWRAEGAVTIFPFPNFDLEHLEQVLEDNKIIIFLRTHHLDHANISRFKKCRRIILMNDDVISDVMQILSIFDLLITDYSSIIVDYLLLNKPALLLAYDRDSYLKSRSLNIDIDSFDFYKEPKRQSEFEQIIIKLVNTTDITEKQKLAQKTFFKYTDNNNCYRHYCAIHDLIESK